MKKFDIKANIDEETFQDKFTLTVTENKQKNVIEMDTCELLDLHNEVKHAVETNIG